MAAGLPGNWGTVKIGVDNNSTSTLGDQIRNGITPAQLATFPDGKIQLDQRSSPPSITFEGNPGISAGIKDDLTSIIGKPVYIPIYDHNRAATATTLIYRVIAFAPVRDLNVNLPGQSQVRDRPAGEDHRRPDGGLGGTAIGPLAGDFRLALLVERQS